MITGGATGIGLGLTERFLAEGNTVIICGRRSEPLQAVKEKHPLVITRVCDLTLEADRLAMYDWIAANHPDLNMLVNNAGIQQWMSIAEQEFYDKSLTEITTNIIAPLHLTSLLLNLSSLNCIINVTSGLAFVQMAKVPVYCATKAFFHSFTLSLRHMLKAKNISVLEMIPPALNTDLGGKGLHDGQPPVIDFVNAVFEQIKAGKTTLTFGFSETMVTAGPEVIAATFNRMNP